MGLLQPPSGPHVDFSVPLGEAALVRHDSLSWRVFKNPVSLFIGGVTAVILELAEPRVRTGVWEHTSFRTQPMARLQRTGLAAMMTVYGPRSQSEKMIANVVRMHGRVAGVTPAGVAYQANDPLLLDWVQATASFGFLEAYSVYVDAVAVHERDAFYAEGRTSAQLYGALSAPASQAELERLFALMQPQLEPSPIIHEFLRIMRGVPVLPGLGRFMQRWLIHAAVELLAAPLRERLGLQAYRLTAGQRYLVCKVARMGDRLMLASGPAVQSCRRMGLPDDYLYRRLSPDQ
jgi:uncharacterized protein (DUF2236 family)